MMAWQRGDLLTIALQGDYGKPRPALVIQSAFFAEHPSATILPITSTLYDAPLFRIPITPTPQNGLKRPSQVMVDKVQSVASERLGVVFGQLDSTTLLSVTRALAVWLGFG